MTDKKDPPIVEQDFLYGMKVVDIGDLRVSRGLSRRPASNCRHINLVFDASERRIWCKDCELNVDSFDAFKSIAEQWASAYKDLDRRQEKLDEVERFKLVSLAAQQLDKVWRKRSMVPACPCCGNGLFPEDFKNGVQSMLGKDYALAKRKKKP